MGQQFCRVSSSPIIAKGSTYDATWTAAALAAPSACWDGTRYVLTCSAWQTSNSQWASLFFTASSLAGPWTYVSGSLRTPSSASVTYILGNGSIAWFGGTYYFTYTKGSGITWNTWLDTSPDLLTWTAKNGGSPILAGTDSHLVINPNNGKLECWGIDSSKNVIMADSPDGSTWTTEGSTWLTAPAWNQLIGGTSSSFGEPGAFYLGAGSGRYLTADALSLTQAGAGNQLARFRGLFYSANSDTSWVNYGSVLGPDPFNSWESFQVFDGQVLGPFDLRNGLGSQFYCLYAGGDVYATTDGTDSSIGLAYAPGLAPQPPSNVRRRRHKRTVRI